MTRCAHIPSHSIPPSTPPPWCTATRTRSAWTSPGRSTPMIRRWISPSCSAYSAPPPSASYSPTTSLVRSSACRTSPSTSSRARPSNRFAI
eukprot:3016612-Rhodomonas_salina.1